MALVILQFEFIIYVYLQPRDVLCGAADEVLIVLKNDRMKDKEKKKEVEGLLGELAEERFALLVNLGKKITDWSQEEKTQTSTKFSFHVCYINCALSWFFSVLFLQVHYWVVDLIGVFFFF